MEMYSLISNLDNFPKGVQISKTYVRLTIPHKNTY